MALPFQTREPICGVAVDQGSGLEKAIREARGARAQQDDLFSFKKIVTQAASPLATTLLVDSTYGPALFEHMHADCIPMLAFEADVYHIDDADRITRLPENLTIEQFPALGAPVLKFFLYYGPNDDEAINARKKALVTDIGRRCRAGGTRFLFEPIVYDRRIADARSAEFSDHKPELVRAAVSEFVKPEYGIDILKIEIPVNLDFVEGFGKARHSDGDARAAVHAVSEAAGDTPFVYLSAGVTFDRFLDSLRFCREASGRASGFVCGRALWSDAIGIFGADGEMQMERWMKTVGADRLTMLREAIS